MNLFDPVLYATSGYPSFRWNFPAAAGGADELAGVGTAVSLTYSFLTAIPSYYAADYGSLYVADGVDTFTPLDPAMQAAVRQALAAWAAVCNLTFTEVADAGAGGQLRFGRHAQDASAGYANVPSFSYAYSGPGRVITHVTEQPQAGDVYISTASYNDALGADQFGFHVLVHEIGHAIGLKHPFEGSTILPTAEDNFSYTELSYTPAANAGIVTVTGSAGGYSWTTGVLYPTGPSLLDIAAVQYLYGANAATNAGDTVYRWEDAPRMFQTIWDGGGVDTLDLGNQTLPVQVDLAEGAFSSIGIRATEADRRREIPDFATAAPTPSYDGRGNLAIAYGAIIENATGGSGDDSIAGNAVGNLLQGGPGQDTLAGQAGDDTLDGGAGADRLEGGPGDDLYRADGSDTIVEAPGAGTDTVVTTVSLVLGDNLERLVLAPGAGDLGGTGNALDNALIGNDGANWLSGLAGADSLSGGAGADTLDGGAGADTLAGGPGDDLYLIGDAGDLALEAPGEGYDRVIATTSLVLGPGIEALAQQAGAGSLLGAGNGLGNLLTGNAAGALLAGFGGDDSLLGGAGADTLVGGEGGDTLQGGAGADWLLGGPGDDSLAGGADRQVDLLEGGAGNDTLDAASGFGDGDLLRGGQGDDLYRIDSPADQVWEAAGEGFDTVIASLAGGGFTLPAQVEALVLAGAAVGGTGNALDNSLTGNALANLLRGGPGADTLAGGAGDDLLEGGAGADLFVLAPGTGQDTIMDFTPGLDRIRLEGFGIPGFAALPLAATGGSTLVALGGGDGLLLVGVAPAMLSAADFLLA